jgi:hypothetical protein
MVEILVRQNNEPLTAPLPNAGGSTSICKQSPFGKDIYFSLQMSIKHLALLKHFGRQCFKTALGKAPKRYK